MSAMYHVPPEAVGVYTGIAGYRQEEEVSVQTDERRRETSM